MAKRPQPKPQSPPADQGPAGGVAAATAPPVAPPIPSQAGAASDEGAGAEGSGPHAGDQASSVSSDQHAELNANASGEADRSHQSDRASNDTESERTDAPAGASASAGAEAPGPSPTQALAVEFAMGDVVELDMGLDLGAVSREHLLEGMRRMSGLSQEEWAGLSPETLDEVERIAVDAFAASATAVKQIIVIVRAAADPDRVEITVRSRDGKPFRRAGFAFGADWRTVQATPDQVMAIKADPGLQLKADA